MSPTGEAPRHDVPACARAWETLRLAHDRVAKRLTTALAAECGLGLSEFDLLLYLRRQGDEAVRLCDLRDGVALSQPALSRLAARLERSGLVARSAATDDGRATLLRLTESGTTLIDRAVGVQARVVHETLTGRFSVSEQAGLLRTLGRIGR